MPEAIDTSRWPGTSGAYFDRRAQDSVSPKEQELISRFRNRMFSAIGRLPGDVPQLAVLSNEGVTNVLCELHDRRLLNREIGVKSIHIQGVDPELGEYMGTRANVDVTLALNFPRIEELPFEQRAIDFPHLAVTAAEESRYSKEERQWVWENKAFASKAGFYYFFRDRRDRGEEKRREAMLAMQDIVNVFGGPGKTMNNLVLLYAVGEQIEKGRAVRKFEHQFELGRYNTEEMSRRRRMAWT